MKKVLGRHLQECSETEILQYGYKLIMLIYDNAKKSHNQILNQISEIICVSTSRQIFFIELNSF